MSVGCGFHFNVLPRTLFSRRVEGRNHPGKFPEGCDLWNRWGEFRVGTLGGSCRDALRLVLLDATRETPRLDERPLFVSGGSEVGSPADVLFPRKLSASVSRPVRAWPALGMPRVRWRHRMPKESAPRRSHACAPAQGGGSTFPGKQERGDGRGKGEGFLLRTRRCSDLSCVTVLLFEIYKLYVLLPSSLEFVCHVWPLPPPSVTIAATSSFGSRRNSTKNTKELSSLSVA